MRITKFLLHLKLSTSVIDLEDAFFWAQTFVIYVLPLKQESTFHNHTKQMQTPRYSRGNRVEKLGITNKNLRITNNSVWIRSGFLPNTSLHQSSLVHVCTYVRKYYCARVHPIFHAHIKHRLGWQLLRTIQIKETNREKSTSSAGKLHPELSFCKCCCKVQCHHFSSTFPLIETLKLMLPIPLFVKSIKI